MSESKEQIETKLNENPEKNAEDGVNQAQEENISKQPKEITVCGHHFFIDNILTQTEQFDMFKIHDDLKREFALKIMLQPELKETYINCLKILKNKPCIASIFEYEVKDSLLHIVFELGQPVDVFSIPKNLLKRRMRQILTAAASIAVNLPVIELIISVSSLRWPIVRLSCITRSRRNEKPTE